MTRHGSDIAIVGAGIAGVSAAYQLSVRHGIEEVVLIDPRPPLSLTSDKSTECYRNWWPNKPMVGLMNRSIDILDELSSETDFGLNRNGYLFVTGEEATFSAMARQVDEIEELGARAELLDIDDLRSGYGFMTDRTRGGVRVERAGWFRAHDLGRWLLDRSRDAGTRLVTEAVTGIDGTNVRLADDTTITSSSVIIAAGPHSRQVAATAGVDLPLFSELHLKVAFKDHFGVIPRDAPMTIWSDPQTIDWSAEERDGLKKAGRDELLEEMPVYCHFRPEGGEESPYILALWEYHNQRVDPTWPLPEDPLYPEVVLRGLTTMVPGLDAYADRLPESSVDGGYYTKTVENRPLLGPSGVKGVHLLAGLSGFGVMAAAGAADLVARHITDSNLPEYSDAFLLSRYDDPAYAAEVEDTPSGQL